MEVLFLAELPPAERRGWQDALTAACPEVTWVSAERAHARPQAVRAAVVANPPPGQLQGLPALALIQSLWAGVDRLLADPGLPAGVPLARMVDPAMSAAMAETVLWAVLSLQRDHFRYARQQAAGQWLQHAQRRADETRVTVLGLGAMGRTAAQALARQGYAVAAWGRQPQPLPDGVRGGFGPEGWAALLPVTDILVNLLPLTPATRGLLDARCFAALPPGAGLVNLARGDHVVDGDLLAALDGGRLAHAVLDVFATEPLPAGHPYWRHPQVTMLPHVAAATDPRSAAAVVSANLQALQRGLPLQHLVDRTRGY